MSALLPRLPVPPRQQLLVGAHGVLALVITQRVGLLSRGQYSDVTTWRFKLNFWLSQERNFRNHQ